MTPNEKDKMKDDGLDTWWGHPLPNSVQLWLLEGARTAQDSTTDDDHGVQNFKYDLVEPFVV